jgi:hypothetical protein
MSFPSLSLHALIGQTIFRGTSVIPVHAQSVGDLNAGEYVFLLGLQQDVEQFSMSSFRPLFYIFSRKPSGSIKR